MLAVPKRKNEWNQIKNVHIYSHFGELYLHTTTSNPNQYLAVYSSSELDMFVILATV